MRPATEGVPNGDSLSFYKKHLFSKKYLTNDRVRVKIKVSKAPHLVQCIGFWCIVLVHSGYDYAPHVQGKGSTIIVKRASKSVNTERYLEKGNDNG